MTYRVAPEGPVRPRLAPSLRIGTPELPGLRAAAPAPGAAQAEARAADGSAARPQAPSLSCILPCRNEAQNLDRLLPRLTEVLATLASEWEVIVVDDGSTDATPQVMTRWCRLAGLRGIELSRNFGKEAALTAGLRAARGDVVITMDADLQHEPELIPEMLAEWREGADTVYAVRRDRSDEGWLKRMGSLGFYKMVNATDRFEVPPGAGDFRLMGRPVVEALLALPERTRLMKGLHAWVGFRTAAVPYMPAPRAHGKSHFSLLRLAGLSLDGLTAFTTWPLRLVGLLGVAPALAALGYGAYLTLNYLLYGHNVSGWTTIVVSLMLFAGVQLLSLGIVGEYVGRVFDEVKARPLFIVRGERGRGLNPRRP